MRFYKKIKLDLPKKPIYSIIISGFLINFARFASAQVELTNPIRATSFEDIINSIAQYAVNIGTPIAAIFIILSGFMFLTARGNEEKLKTAKTMLLWTIVGAVIIIGARIFASVAIRFAQNF